MELIQRRMISTEDLAKLFGCSKSTVRNWRTRGTGPKPIRLFGGKLIRYDAAEVETLVSQAGQAV